MTITLDAYHILCSQHKIGDRVKVYQEERAIRFGELYTKNTPLPKNPLHIYYIIYTHTGIIDAIDEFNKSMRIKIDKPFYVIPEKPINYIVVFDYDDDSYIKTSQLHNKYTKKVINWKAHERADKELHII